MNSIRRSVRQREASTPMPTPKPSETARKLQDEKKPGDVAAAGTAVPPAQGADVPALAAAQPKPGSAGQSPTGAAGAPMKSKTAPVQFGQGGGKAPAAPQASVSASRPAGAAQQRD